MANLLVPGTIEVIFSDEKHPNHSQFNTTDPWLQVLSVKTIPIADGTTRIRVILSDGRNYGQAMLNTMLNSFALSDSPLLKTNAVIRVTQFTVNKTKDKKFFLLLNFDKENVTFLEQRVGEPTSLEKDNTAIEPVSRSNGIQQPSNDLQQRSIAPPATIPTQPQSKPPIAPQQKQESAATNTRNQSESFTAPSKTSTSSFSSTSKQIPADSSSIDESTIHPIASLTPYNNKWTIKARVISKTELKSWSNAKGEGKLFNMTLMDASGEIRCTAFKDVAIMFHPLFELNKVYIIGKGTIKMVNSKWTGMSSPGGAIPANNYEMQLEKTTFVRAVPENESAGSIPAVKFFFLPIGQIEEREKDSIIDVIGVVKDCGEVASIRSKTTQKQLLKRDITLVDLSRKSIKLTLWGDMAETFNVVPQENPVVAFKSVRVTEFNGKSLSSLSSTTYLVNPDMHEAYEIRGWFDANGSSTDFESISISNRAGLDKGSSLGMAIPSGPETRKPLSVWKEELPAAHSAADKGEFFSVTGTIARIKHTAGVSYPACPTEGCNKKVIDIGMGQWKCEKCNQVFPSCMHRYMFTMAINDYSSSIWVNVFDDAGQIVFGGRKAEELVYLRQNDESVFEQAVRDCEHKMAKFRIKAKAEFYQGEQKMRYSLIGINAISFEEECKSMLEVIRQFDSK